MECIPSFCLASAGNHDLGNNRYVIRKRWDYFVRHLMGVDPPKEYSIKPFEDERKQCPPTTPTFHSWAGSPSGNAGALMRSSYLALLTGAGAHSSMNTLSLGQYNRQMR